MEISGLCRDVFCAKLKKDPSSSHRLIRTLSRKWYIVCGRLLSVVLLSDTVFRVTGASTHRRCLRWWRLALLLADILCPETGRFPARCPRFRTTWWSAVWWPVVVMCPVTRSAYTSSRLSQPSGDPGSGSSVWRGLDGRPIRSASSAASISNRTTSSTSRCSTKDMRESCSWKLMPYLLYSDWKIPQWKVLLKNVIPMVFSCIIYTYCILFTCLYTQRE